MKAFGFIGILLVCNLWGMAQKSKEFIDSPAYIIAMQKQGRLSDKPTVQPSDTPSSVSKVSVSTPSNSNNSHGNVSKEQPERKPKQRKETITRRIYGSVEVGISFNWFADVNLPFLQKGIEVLGTPRILMDVYLGRGFYWGFGLGFHSMGGRLIFPNSKINDFSEVGLSSYENVMRKYQLSYLQIPIYFKYQSPQIAKDWSIFANLGIDIGMKVLGRYADEYKDFRFSSNGTNILNGTYRETGKLGKQANFWDVAVGTKLGASYSLPKNLSFKFGIGYHYSFLNALSQKHIPSNGVYPLVNCQQFEIFAGFGF